MNRSPKMYGRIHSVQVNFDQLHGRDPSRIVEICAEGVHLRVGLRSTSFAGSPVFAQMKGAEINGPCDRSCKGQPYDLKDEIMRDAEAYGYDVENLAGPKAWKHFAESIRKGGYQPQARGRRFVRTVFEDGDSDSQQICCGAYHVVVSCDEFGSGCSYRISGHCDRACRPCSIELPSAIADQIRGWQMAQV